MADAVVCAFCATLVLNNPAGTEMHKHSWHDCTKIAEVANRAEAGRAVCVPNQRACGQARWLIQINRAVYWELLAPERARCGIE